MNSNLPNLLANLPERLPEELFETLTEQDGVRIERIVSTGHASPEDFWYDQDEHEWIMVLKGEAELQFRDTEPITMKPGNYRFIPAHEQHRVAWTSPDEPTVWLAVFFRPR